jgi:enoyl-CoA hydratase
MPVALETLIVDVEDHVGLIRLNRPEALNALNFQLLDELGAALAEMDASAQVRAIVVTGSEKAFAAGADVKDMAPKGFAEMFTEDCFTPQTEAILRVRKPIIAAVAGYCLGGGCELAMMCDFIIAADTAKFGQPEINLGVIPGMGGTQRLTRVVGKSKAMEMCLTGRFMDAAEAERAGLVSRVVPARDLLRDARETAAKIAEKSPLTVRAAKEAVNRSYETTLREGLLFERRLFHALFASEDQAEGMAAFAEKRSPQFRGR